MNSMTSIPRLSLGAVLFCGMTLVAPASAQSPSPLPPAAPPASAPPPLPDVGSDLELEPQVTIIRTETETIEEARINGELRYLKVTPRGGGRPYYLVPSGNGQTFIRRDSLDFGLRVPMWQLFSW
jgi:hypothetical protein